MNFQSDQELSGGGNRNYSLAAKLPDVKASGFNPRPIAKIHHALKGRMIEHPFRMRFMLIPLLAAASHIRPSPWDDDSKFPCQIESNCSRWSVIGYR